MNLNSFLLVVLLSAAPFFELRGGIPLGIALGMNPALAFIIGVSANIIVVFLLFLFLDYLHKHLLVFSLYKRTFNYFLNNVRKKTEKHIKAWEYWALFAFVALPIPGTGAYAGTLISWFFNLDRRKAIYAISLGVITSGLLVTLVTLGIVHFF